MLLESRSAACAVLGAERVFGFGAEGAGCDYAELLTDAGWRPGRGWRLTAPRVLDPSQPVGTDGGVDIGWWLHAQSARAVLRARAASR